MTGSAVEWLIDVTFLLFYLLYSPLREQNPSSRRDCCSYGLQRPEGGLALQRCGPRDEPQPEPFQHDGDRRR